MTSERFIDAGQEFIQSLPPIDEFQNDTSLSLEEVIFDVRKWIPYHDQIVAYAKKKSSKPKDGLTVDESASINVYTMEETKPERSICVQLDRAFRSKEKNQLQSWFPYIGLFLTALKKLPSIKCTVYRGVRGDVSDQYQQSYIWWRGFSCCTNSVTQMKKILGSKGIRTIFEIHCINGKSIQNHSCLRDKNEILLMPNTYLRVLGRRNLGSELYMIGLQEEQIPDEIIASSENLPPSSTKKIFSNEPHLKDPNQSNGQQSFIQTCGMRDLSKAHPTCQFQAEQYWFECQYHEDDNQLIKKPDELERNMQDPPPKFNSDDTITQVISRKYQHLKTLVLKLKSNNTDKSNELDVFVDEILNNLEKTLLSNSNDLRQRIKKIRPDPNDPRYNDKMIIYKELLEQMIVLNQKLQNVISQTLDDFHIVIEELWNDISTNNGNNINRLLEEHENSLNGKWMNNIKEIEIKLNSIEI
ncbi:unnamed protein product [Adineta steineri]|uniref:NAD(P)(+)--arginine ADP-ribosyltransferase n=1 Tax=Adineta steineri TaxID=433720 RepID=A0A814FNK6_9BILA|nr:unnamed protein product [Adineta steineri]